MSRHRPSLEQIERQVELFNKAFAIGDVILVHPVYGEPETVERTIVAPGAHVMGGHSAVVQVSGGGGCWGLRHVAGKKPAKSSSNTGEEN